MNSPQQQQRNQRKGKSDRTVWQAGKAASDQKRPFYSRGGRDWVVTTAVVVIIGAGGYVAYTLAENKAQGKKVQDLFKPKTRKQGGFVYDGSGQFTNGFKLTTAMILLAVVTVLYATFFTEEGKQLRMKAKVQAAALRRTILGRKKKISPPPDQDQDPAAKSNTSRSEARKSSVISVGGRFISKDEAKDFAKLLGLKSTSNFMKKVNEANKAGTGLRLTNDDLFFWQTPNYNNRFTTPDDFFEVLEDMGFLREDIEALKAERKATKNPIKNEMKDTEILKLISDAKQNITLIAIPKPGSNSKEKLISLDQVSTFD